MSQFYALRVTLYWEAFALWRFLRDRPSDIRRRWQMAVRFHRLRSAGRGVAAFRLPENEVDAWSQRVVEAKLAQQALQETNERLTCALKTIAFQGYSVPSELANKALTGAP